MLGLYVSDHPLDGRRACAAPARRVLDHRAPRHGRRRGAHGRRRRDRAEPQVHQARRPDGDVRPRRHRVVDRGDGLPEDDGAVQRAAGARRDRHGEGPPRRTRGHAEAHGARDHPARDPPRHAARRFGSGCRSARSTAERVADAEVRSSPHIRATARCSCTSSARRRRPSCNSATSSAATAPTACSPSSASSSAPTASPRCRGRWGAIAASRDRTTAASSCATVDFPAAITGDDDDTRLARQRRATSWCCSWTSDDLAKSDEIGDNSGPKSSADANRNPGRDGPAGARARGVPVAASVTKCCSVPAPSTRRGSGDPTSEGVGEAVAGRLIACHNAWASTRPSDSRVRRPRGMIRPCRSTLQRLPGNTIVSMAKTSRSTGTSSTTCCRRMVRRGGIEALSWRSRGCTAFHLVPEPSSWRSTTR